MKHHSQKPTSTFSLWHVLYVVFFIWAGVLYYYHHNHHPSHIDAYSGMELPPSVVATIGGDSSQFQRPPPHKTVPQQQPQQPPPQSSPVTHSTPLQPPVESQQQQAPPAVVLTPPEKNLRVNSVSNVASAAVVDRMHIVFSTDCTFFQDWQTLLVFYSAQQAHQQGDITRIASGCPPAKQRELKELYNKLFPQYRVHFTPDFKTDNKTKKSYDFYNKPFGLHHWLLNADPKIEDGVVVILIDPDMIILRPFTLDLAGNPANIFYDTSVDPKDPNLPKKIGKGVPVAQIYGLGAPWAIDGHRHFNRHKICGENSPCLKVTRQYGAMHYR